MEKSVQCMSGNKQLNYEFNVFGIRHLSPAGSHQLIKFLNEKKPKLVLIEGPFDGTELITQISRDDIKPPIAILAYTTSLPIKTILYPFADYSPEYQAIKWASKNNAKAKFIDLPTNISVKIHGLSSECGEDKNKYNLFVEETYKELYKISNEEDFESYWERNFELNIEDNVYRNNILLQSLELRNILEEEEAKYVKEDTAYNEVRESFMRWQIQSAIVDGYKPSEIVVVTGAYHSSKLSGNPISKNEFEKFPKVETKLTLMPYSYFRLSSQSGYGAGNHGPAYFELMWNCMCKGEIEKLSTLYFSHLGSLLREDGVLTSTANVIEGVRLANALAFLQGGRWPVLKDLHDAAVSCFGHGEYSTIATACAKVDVGTSIGFLPEGVSQTPIQDDMNRQLKKLNLEKYKTNVALDLDLDLRENHRVKSVDAAFMDLNRSTFLHRLRFLGISFVTFGCSNQTDATWAEKWVLRWTPEAEIEVVESTLRGETIELAAAFLLHEKMEACTDVVEISKLIHIACICNLTSSLDDAIRKLQSFLVGNDSFVKIAFTAREISIIIQYGNLRKFDQEIFKPILQQLFLRACLLLVDNAVCDEVSAKKFSEGINVMHLISQEHFDLVNDDYWLKELDELASRDDKNPILSGLAFSILLERNQISEDHCKAEVSRRLSIGIPADIGAGWFEGLSSRNRYVLLSRTSLWTQLDSFINQLDDGEFLRAVVFMRRAFSNFEPKEKNSIAELLGDIWNVNPDEAAEILQGDLSEEEEETLNELADFDFSGF